jgi:ABC-2 type transport system permease protein
MTVLSPLLSLFYSTANGGQTWTFDYFMQQVMISNCTLFFPIIIALIAGYIITREYTDDTMKNISTIPISYKQLLSGKLLVLLLLTICFSFIGCVLALVINVIAGFPGVHFGNLLNMFIRVTGANLGIYISVLPIILLFCCSVNNFLGGVALAFVYGYFGTFEGTLLNYYPIKASMILVDPTCGAEYGYTYHIFPAFITIVLTFLISVIILANKKKEPSTLTVTKKKKVVRKKGWWRDGTLAVFDIEESGKQIGEKLFLLLNEEQKNALMQYILEQGVCHGTVFNSCHTSSAAEKNPLTEIQEGELYLCLEHRTVRVRERIINLTSKEFDILALLIANPKRVFTYELITDLVWKEDCDFYSRKAIHNHISKLRKKLRFEPDLPNYIESVAGIGYKFEHL